jgi:hypothetical protein
MNKTVILTAAVALGFAAPRDAGFDGTSYALKEERVFIEYTPGANEAVVVMEAESEIGLMRVEVISPRGTSALSLRAQDLGSKSISGFVVETTEAPLAEILLAYGEGRYPMRARTENGLPAIGGAELAHDLLDEPQAIYPFEGAINVPINGLTLQWKNDPQALGYTVILEQDDNDGLAIEMPAGSSSLVVPDGFLKAGTETFFEISALGPSGNRTILETQFTTL